jgi:hypothetical protein
MTRLRKPALLIALVLGFLVIGRSGIAQSTLAAATRYDLRGTYTDSGYYGAGGLYAPRSVSVAIGTPLTVTCPSNATCTIQADLWIQTGKVTVTRDQYSLCLSVDGALAPNCQDVGSTPSDNTYADGSTSQLVGNLPHGAHTVQGFFASTKGAYVFNYTFNYRVYTP